MVRIVLQGFGLFALIAALAGCERDAQPPSPCVGGKPAIERTSDVAPPDCAA